MNHFTWSSITRAALAVCVGMLLLGVGARAQQWQSVAGGFNFETGEGGGAPLAAGNGYITVGSTNSFNPVGTYDVYVAEWNNAGGLLWAFAYDLGAGVNDYGFDIQECMNGDFIITGRTDINGGDLFLLRINAGGGPIWAETFGGPLLESGIDVMETVNGDIVAVGESHPFMAANQDGLVVRTNPFGGLIFAQTYDAPAGMNEDLRGLDEAFNGDLLVCGSTNSWGAGIQGWIMRLNPFGAVMWAVNDGSPADEVFNSIIELRVGAQSGNIVAVGGTTQPAPGDMYAVKYDAVGTKMADLNIGTNFALEEAYQIREANVVPNAGDLLIVGHTNPGPLGGDDGYVVDIAPRWVGVPVILNWSMAYGGFGADWISSGDEDLTQPQSGFFLCGTTQSPNLLPAGDPQQLWAIRTNTTGISTCNEARVCDRIFAPNNNWFHIPLVWIFWQWGVYWPVPWVPGQIWQGLCFTPWPPPPGPIAPPPGGGHDHEQVPNDQSTSGQISEVAPQDAHARELTNAAANNGISATKDSTATPGNQR